jgi:hypothetical protein
VSGLRAVEPPHAATEAIVFHSFTDSRTFEVVSLDPRDGKVLWRAAASPSGVATGVGLYLNVLDDDRVVVWMEPSAIATEGTEKTVSASIPCLASRSVSDTGRPSSSLTFTSRRGVARGPPMPSVRRRQRRRGFPRRSVSLSLQPSVAMRNHNGMFRWWPSGGAAVVGVEDDEGSLHYQADLPGVEADVPQGLEVLQERVRAFTDGAQRVVDPVVLLLVVGEGLATESVGSSRRAASR